MDQNVTKQIEKFLSIAKPSDEQIREGALLLLRLNQSARGLYNSAMARPQSMLPWIQADLKKYLGIRKRGLKTSETEAYNRETERLVKQTLTVVPAEVAKAIGNVPESAQKGKRPDHDQLPEHIQEIWPKNAERWKKLRQMHIQLGVMIKQPGYQPCDGNELCHALRQLDADIRNDYRRYDEYDVNAPTANKDSVDTFADNVKTIQAARTTISRGLQRKKQDDKSLEKIQQAVNTLFDLQQVIKPATVEKLKAIGISVPDAKG